MKFKKLVSLSLTVIISAGVLVGCGSKADSSSKGEKITVGMITDVGGVHDESFNQSSWEGLQAIQKELGEDKIEVKYLESKQDSDYTPNIEQYVDEDTDLIIGVGYKLADALETAAKHYEDQEFAIIDHVYEKQPENITSLSFESNESSFLAGLIAGKSTKTNKVAFIGGQESPVISKFEYGFKAGVQVANPDAEVLVQYSNSYSDQALGKSIANSMISKGADVIFPCAGACGTGAIEAVKEANKMAVGVDRDQSDLAPNNMLTSAMKNIDVAVANLVRDFANGNYKGGEIKNGTLENDGVGLAPTTDKNVSKEILEYVKEQAQQIKDGKIDVPNNEEELKSFNK
ncbi:BMP family lipoprotein [Terrisporobacter sp.]